MKTWLKIMLLAVLYLNSPRIALGQEPAEKVAAPAEAPATAAVSPITSRYYIGSGDVLDIRVYNRPALSLDAVRVDSRGMIRMPLIEDEIQAACRTESELAREITAGYLKYQRNPQVFVYVKEYNSQPVAVIGAVNKPGRFQLQRRVRLLELITFAGGPTEKAGKRVQLAHTPGLPTCDPSGSISAPGETASDLEIYDFNDTLVGNDKSNPYIQPGDVITVTEAEQAFVTGNVFKPSAVVLKESVTVSQAVAMAGGTLPDSNLTRIRLIRRTPGAATKSETLINLTAINQRRADDPRLEPGDIVEVPTTGGKKFLRSLLGAVVPATANLPIYVLR
ncbi:MAG TPA: polysaccharide biosynthesis/export family protein [Blastocatellia bacterium]|nr:polysaccharide biosynthesis/export family protein [Blastocatellia bacterium]